MSPFVMKLTGRSDDTSIRIHVISVKLVSIHQIRQQQ